MVELLLTMTIMVNATTSGEGFVCSSDHLKLEVRVAQYIVLYAVSLG